MGWLLFIPAFIAGVAFWVGLYVIACVVLQASLPDEDEFVHHLGRERVGK